MTNSRFVQNYVASVQAFITAWDALRAADRVYQDTGVGSSLLAADMPTSLSSSSFIAAVGSWEAIDAWIVANNHWTNLYKLLP